MQSRSDQQTHERCRAPARKMTISRGRKGLTAAQLLQTEAVPALYVPVPLHTRSIQSHKMGFRSHRRKAQQGPNDQGNLRGGLGKQPQPRARAADGITAAQQQSRATHQTANASITVSNMHPGLPNTPTAGQQAIQRTKGLRWRTGCRRGRRIPRGRRRCRWRPSSPPTRRSSLARDTADANQHNETKQSVHL